MGWVSTFVEFAEEEQEEEEIASELDVSPLIRPSAENVGGSRWSRSPNFASTGEGPRMSTAAKWSFHPLASSQNDLNP